MKLRILDAKKNGNTKAYVDRFGRLFFNLDSIFELKLSVGATYWAAVDDDRAVFPVIVQGESIFLLHDISKEDDFAPVTMKKDPNPIPGSRARYFLELRSIFGQLGVNYIDYEPVFYVTNDLFGERRSLCLTLLSYTRRPEDE